MDLLSVYIYKDPSDKTFIVHGCIDIVAPICMEIGGLFYPYLLHAYENYAIKGAYRIGFDKYQLFLEMLNKLDGYIGAVEVTKYGK